jgi:hypothetical protein
MRIVAVFVFLAFSISQKFIVAQNSIPTSKWAFSQVDFGLGIDNDHYESMSLENLMAFAKDPEQLKRDLKGMDEEATTSTAGGAFYINAGFSPLKKSEGTYRSDRMLRLGMGIHTPKEAMITYKNEGMDTSIVYCNLQSEITWEAAYLFMGTWGKNERWHWYWGGGMSVGTTFNNKMLIIAGGYLEPGEHPSSQPSDEMNKESYDAKSVLYGRVYVPYGISYATGAQKKWLFGFDFKTGVGAQKIEGESANYIKKTGAFIIGVKYRFL